MKENKELKSIISSLTLMLNLYIDKINSEINATSLILTGDELTKKHEKILAKKFGAENVITSIISYLNQNIVKLPTNTSLVYKKVLSHSSSYLNSLKDIHDFNDTSPDDVKFSKAIEGIQKTFPYLRSRGIVW